MPMKNRLSKEAIAILIEDIGDEIVSRLNVDEVVSHLNVDEVVSRLSVDEVVSCLSVEQRLAGLKPEALTTEERRQIQRLLEQ